MRVFPDAEESQTEIDRPVELPRGISTLRGGVDGASERTKQRINQQRERESRIQPGATRTNRQLVSIDKIRAIRTLMTKNPERLDKSPRPRSLCPLAAASGAITISDTINTTAAALTNQKTSGLRVGTTCGNVLLIQLRMSRHFVLSVLFVPFCG